MHISTDTSFVLDTIKKLTVSLISFMRTSYSSYSIVVQRRRRRKVSSTAQQKSKVKQPQGYCSTSQDAMQMQQNDAYTTVDYQLEGYYEQLT